MAVGPLPPQAGGAGAPAPVNRPAPGRTRLLPADERGSALVFVLVLLVVILSIMSIAVDLGMLYAARTEAQRAADAAALAGASAFVDVPPQWAADTAAARARDYAARNPIQHTAVAAEEVRVQVIADSAKVRVWIRRGNIGTWFAGIFGVDSAAVGARAAAEAAPAPKTSCVKPFAPPDMWHDADDDLNGNRIPDGLEIWKYDPKAGDYYLPFTGNDGATPPETGYWSTYRGPNRDYGRQIVIKLTDADLTQIPGLYYIWQLDENDTSGSGYRNQIRRCFEATFEIGQEYKLLGGDRQGPTFQGVSDLVSQDPGAYWDERLQRVEGSRYTPWWQSPRVVKIPFYAPNTLNKSKKAKFTHFSWVFIEGMASENDPVLARYVNVVRKIRLVQ